MTDLRGVRGTCATTGGPNSFNFMQILGKFGKIVCWRPHLGEILDPPLVTPIIASNEILETQLKFSVWSTLYVNK